MKGNALWNPTCLSCPDDGGATSNFSWAMAMDSNRCSSRSRQLRSVACRLYMKSRAPCAVFSASMGSFRGWVPSALQVPGQHQSRSRAGRKAVRLNRGSIGAARDGKPGSEQVQEPRSRAAASAL